LEVNGFSWKEASEGSTSAAVGEAITALFTAHKIRRGAAVFICQNPSFDRPFFSQLIAPEVQEARLWPYHWLDLASMYWTRSVREEGHLPTGCSKNYIASVYGLPPEETPHRALAGVRHLLLCYHAVIDKGGLCVPGSLSV
jgi:DNA polymerase-3 subunit epsilon/oligoribonuclease